MKKLTLPRLASAVLGALFFLAACIVLAVRLVRGEAGLTDAAALVLTAAGGAALTVLALRSRAPGLRRSLWVLLAAAAVFLVFYGLAQQTPSVPMSTVQQATMSAAALSSSRRMPIRASRTMRTSPSASRPSAWSCAPANTAGRSMSCRIN